MSIKRVTLGLLAFVCAALLAPIAQAQKDSLRQLVVQATTDTARITALNTLGVALMYDSPDTAIVLGRQALALLARVESERHLATTLAFLGTYFDIKGDFDSALVYYFRSLPIRERRKDGKGTASVLNNIGIVYMERSDYPKSLEYYTKAMAIHESMGNRMLAAGCYNNIANVYLKLSDYPTALKFYFKSLEIKEAINDLEGQAETKANLGLVYKRQGNLDKAIEYYLAALRIDEQLDYQYGIAIDYSSLATAYSERGEFAKSLEFSRKSMAMDKRLGDKQNLATSYNNIGNAYFNAWSKGSETQASVGDWAARNPKLLLDSAYYYRLLAYDLNKVMGAREAMTYNLTGMGAILVERGRYPEAIKSYESALSLAQEVKAKMREYEAYHGLAGTYERWALSIRDDRKRAEYLANSVSNLVRYMEVKDSVLNKEKQKEIGKLETRHEFEIAAIRKQQEEQEQARQAAAALNRRDNLQYSAILIGLCALFGAVYFLGRLRLPKWAVEFSVFVPFLILFEFLGVLFDPYGERWTGGAPGYKLLINALMAGLIFPIHSFFEQLMKRKLFSTS